ncbi:MAG TPA: IPT/TIG domain-containing protein [Trueperaceae bacterium]
MRYLARMRFLVLALLMLAACTPGLPPAPSIAEVQSASGPTEGGTTVVITGENFTGASAVLFGETPAASFEVLSDTEITAVTPESTQGAVNITVTTTSGSSIPGATDQFTFLAVTGSLELNLTDPPSGETGSVTVTGPAGYNETVTSDTTLTDPPAGTYTVTPTLINVEVANSGYVGVERFEVDAQQVEVMAGATASATIAYTYVGFTISDAADDAVSSSMSYPTYELTELRSVVEGDTMEETLTFIESQVEFSALQAVIDFDVDQDETTSASSIASKYCAASPDIGSEYFLSYETAGAQIMETATSSNVGTALVSASGNTITFFFPLSVIGDDGRVDGAIVVGNYGGPTDCVPFGVVN